MSGANGNEQEGSVKSNVFLSILPKLPSAFVKYTLFLFLLLINMGRASWLPLTTINSPV